MIYFQENEETQEEEVYDYLNEEPLEEDDSVEYEEPDYCD